jgi:Fe2+ or Zn2+ uptake regulation protein
MPVVCTSCGSSKIEPQGDHFHCNGCGKDSDIAGGNIDEFLPKEQPKKPRKKGG